MARQCGSSTSARKTRQTCSYDAARSNLSIPGCVRDGPRKASSRSILAQRTTIYRARAFWEGFTQSWTTIRFFLSIRNSPGFGRSLRRTQIQPMKVITRRGIREGTASGMPLAKLARRQNDGLLQIRESHQRQFRFPFCGILMRARRTPSSISADDGHRVLPDFSLVPLMKTPCPCP